MFRYASPVRSRCKTPDGSCTCEALRSKPVELRRNKTSVARVTYFAMAKNKIAERWLNWAACGLLLVIAGCAESQRMAPPAAPPIPAGQARVWFYRPWEPSESLNLASVDLNGTYVGAVANGGA